MNASVRGTVSRLSLSSGPQPTRKSGAVIIDFPSEKLATADKQISRGPDANLTKKLYLTEAN